MINRVSGQRRERRVFERFKVSFPARLLDLGCGVVLQAEICDLSAQGVGAAVQQEISQSAPLKIWLNFPGRRKAFRTQGRAVWSTPLSDEAWRVGVKLARPELMGF